MTTCSTSSSATGWNVLLKFVRNSSAEAYPQSSQLLFLIHSPIIIFFSRMNSKKKNAPFKIKDNRRGSNLRFMQLGTL